MSFGHGPDGSTRDAKHLGRTRKHATLRGHRQRPPRGREHRAKPAPSIGPIGRSDEARHVIESRNRVRHNERICEKFCESLPFRPKPADDARELARRSQEHKNGDRRSETLPCLVQAWLAQKKPDVARRGKRMREREHRADKSECLASRVHGASSKRANSLAEGHARHATFPSSGTSHRDTRARNF